MVEQDDLFTARLRPFARRIRQLLLERMICRGLAIAGAVAVLLLIVDKLLPAWYVTPEALVALLLLGPLAGGLFQFFRPLSDLAVAVTVDHRLQLRDRAGTAIALAADAGSDPAFRELVTRDAADHLDTANPVDVFPRRLQRDHKAALAAWAGVLLMLVLPLLPFWYSAADQADRANMRAAGRQLTEQAHKLEQHPELKKNRRLKRIANQMQRLGTEMRRNRIDKREALKRLNKLNDELAKAKQELAKRNTTTPQDLRNASKAFQNALAGRDKSEADLARRAQEKLAHGEKPTQAEQQALDRQQAMEKLEQGLSKGDPKAAEEALRELGNALQQSDQLSDGQKQALSDALNQMGQSLPNDPELAKALQDAAKALKNGQHGQTDAGKMLSKMNLSKEGLEALKDALEASKNAKGNLNGNIAEGLTPGNKPGGKPGDNGNLLMPGGDKPGGNMPGGDKPGGDKPGGNMPGGNQPGQNGNAMVPGGTPGTTPGSGPGMVNRTNPGQPLKPGLTPHGTSPLLSPEERAMAIDTNESGATGAPNRSNVPYYDVYPDYRSKAESAMNNDNIPVNERKRVRDYFGALDPGKGE